MMLNGFTARINETMARNHVYYIDSYTVLYVVNQIRRFGWLSALWKEHKLDGYWKRVAI